MPISRDRLGRFASGDYTGASAVKTNHQAFGSLVTSKSKVTAAKKRIGGR